MKNAVVMVKLGLSTNLCFENQDEALDFYKLALKAVPVTNNYSELPGGRKDVNFIRVDDASISLDRVDRKKVELMFSKEELEERAAAKDDIEGDARVTDDPISICFEPKLITAEELTDVF